MLLRAAAILILLCSPAAAREVVIGFIDALPPRTLTSPIDRPRPDEGLAGAKVALAEIQRAGRLAKMDFRLISQAPKAGDEARRDLAGLVAAGAAFIVVRADGAATLALADAAPTGVTILNAAAPDDALRDGNCRANLLHTAPSRAMLADALTQFLVARRWPRWLLLVGPGEGDRLFAAALRRAAQRFGGRIVDEKAWTMTLGQGRADTGHVTLQAEIPALTRGADHDVLVVADESDLFGDYLEGRTFSPRPVAGTHGLVATGFSPVSDAWGATQLHDRLEKLAGRRMSDGDYAAWAAVRAIGEAALRADSTEPAVILRYLRSPDFTLGGFKGRGQSFRPWDGQMRQPILIAGSRMLVSVSPQPGFLHRTSELDTLGIDREESRCRF